MFTFYDFFNLDNSESDLLLGITTLACIYTVDHVEGSVLHRDCFEVFSVDQTRMFLYVQSHRFSLHSHLDK